MVSCPICCCKAGCPATISAEPRGQGPWFTMRGWWTKPTEIKDNWQLRYRKDVKARGVVEKWWDGDFAFSGCVGFQTCFYMFLRCFRHSSKLRNLALTPTSPQALTVHHVEGKQRASQWVTLARWRMEAVLVLPKAVCRTSQASGINIVSYSLLHWDVYFYMYTCGPMTHVFPKLTPSIVAPRDQDKESKRSWMTGGWELCVAQAVQTLCSHEEGHIVQSANLCQLKHLSLKGKCFGKEGCTPVLPPRTNAGILEQPTSSTRVKHYRFSFSGIIGIFLDSFAVEWVTLPCWESRSQIQFGDSMTWCAG